MPRVYDKEGRELTVGARVRHAKDGRIGRVAEFQMSHKKVRVKWEHRSRLAAIGASINPLYVSRVISLSDSFFPHLTAPDLLLIDSPTEGKEG